MTMGGLETALGKAAIKAGSWATGRVVAAELQRRLIETSRSIIAARAARDALNRLDDLQTRQLADYLESPDFEEIALQLILARLLNFQKLDEAKAAIREQLRYGLHHSLRAEPYLVTILADVLFDALMVTAQEIPPSQIEAGRKGDAFTVAVLAHLTAAGTANSHLLRTLPELTEARRLATDLRRQVTLLHSGMHLPHVGASRKVPYPDLYVHPPVYRLWSRPTAGADDPPVIPEDLVKPGRRNVVLGSPGAGKSTLLSKLAYDLATDAIPDLAGRVPFLVTLRHFGRAFIQGERGLPEYLEAVCRDPYNLSAPPHAVEYLLRNGRAVVLLDGLDELVDQDLRTRVARLVEGFANQYPIVPVVLTARKVGYEAAPLDSALFHISELNDFNDDQVADYAHKWFLLDEATPVGTRETLATTFLSESAESASELRKSPLLLALLCAMYSSEHYIPRHVSQVYERCAVMLFERWDSMRGIPLSQQFRGRIRGAVQYLAWLQLNNQGQEAIPATRILHSVENYLQAKQLDPDDARAAAEDFLAFCTDRSWVLTDTGSSEDEARYGFTHRTFMEYFAAEHLVRTNRTAEQLWDVLESKIAEGSWDVVGQVALQLYDRNVDDGSDELLHLLLERMPEDTEARSQLLAFAARSLNHVTPAPRTTAAIAQASLDMMLERPFSQRFPLLPPARLFDDLLMSDGPFNDLLDIRLPENVQAAAAAVTPILAAQADGSGNAAARFSLLNWPERTAEDTTPLISAILQQAVPVRPAGPPPVVMNGLTSIRADPSFLFRYAAIDRHLHGPEFILPGSASRDICATLVGLPAPWISGSEWRAAVLAADLSEPWFRHIRNNVDQRDYFLQPLLLLPYLETSADPAVWAQLPVAGNPASILLTARHQNAKLAVPTVPLPGSLEQAALTFLTDWAQNKISVLSDD